MCRVPLGGFVRTFWNDEAVLLALARQHDRKLPTRVGLMLDTLKLCEAFLCSGMFLLLIIYITYVEADWQKLWDSVPTHFSKTASEASESAAYQKTIHSIHFIFSCSSVVKRLNSFLIGSYLETYAVSQALGAQSHCGFCQ